MRFAKDLKASGTSRARISRSYIAGRKATMIDCPLLPGRLGSSAGRRDSRNWSHRQRCCGQSRNPNYPIVFISGGDPVEFKLVDSLNRPGGNLTGVNFLANTLASKQLELLHQIVPGTAPIGVLVNPTNPTLADQLWKDAETAARSLGMQVRLLHASTERDFAMVLQTLAQLGAGALLIGVDGFFTSRVGLLAQLTVEHAVPAMYF